MKCKNLKQDATSFKEDRKGRGGCSCSSQEEAVPNGASSGELASDALFANIRLAARMLTNLYNFNMPAVTVKVGANLTKAIPLKITQLVVLQALYDTRWWDECRQRRMNRADAERRELLEKYYEKNGGMVVQIALARQLGLDCTTVCRNLKALVDSGWVCRKRSEVSQREVLVGLTDQGRQVVESAMARARDTSSLLDRKLGGSFVTKLNSQLNTLIEKCGDLATM